MPRKREPRDAADNTVLFFEPRTDRQRDAIEVFDENDLTFLTGPAGTGKTHLAVYLALREMERQGVKARKRIERTVITRPIVEAGEYLGALPGEVDEKVHPYMRPVYDCVSKFVNNSDQFIANNFEISPLAYMRGVTFENRVAILDEAQNCTIGQLLLFMSRLGFGGKMIISGDTDQSDIQRSGLRAWVESLRGVRGIGFVEFRDEDIVRHSLVREILKRKPQQLN